MWKTRSDCDSKRVSRRAARGSSPFYLKSNFKIGDRVRVIEIPEDTKDPKADLKSPEAREMRTAELFRFCLGRVFTVYGFERYGHVELRVGQNREVRRKLVAHNLDRAGVFETSWSPAPKGAALK